MTLRQGKYRKKPVVIEAVQLPGDCLVGKEGPAWYLEAIAKDDIYIAGHFPPSVKIRTLEGLMTGLPYDWIIRGVNGELYPCKPNIFDKTYEAVDLDGVSSNKQAQPECDARGGA